MKEAAVYIELFMLDDLLMNLLIVRLAAALLSVRPPLYREFGVAFVSSLFAALAAFRFPILAKPAFRLPLLTLITLSLPAKSPRAFLVSAAAVLFSTFTVGGLAVCIAFLTGGGVSGGFIRGGTGLRAAALPAAGASFLPAAARRVLKRRIKNAAAAKVVILHGGFLRSFTALVDTGNCLSEPLSGLPVAVVRCRALERYAFLPIPAVTAAGNTTLRGFLPDKISVDGTEVACVVAVTKARLSADAIIPPSVCPADGAGEEGRT